MKYLPIKTDYSHGKDKHVHKSLQDQSLFFSSLLLDGSSFWLLDLYSPKHKCGQESYASHHLIYIVVIILPISYKVCFMFRFFTKESITYVGMHTLKVKGTT